MPSREIINVVKPSTPRNAAVPVLSVELRQHAFPQRLVRGALQQERGADADQDGERDAPAHGSHQLVAAGFAKIRDGDCDNQEGLEAFPKSNDKRRRRCADRGDELHHGGYDGGRGVRSPGRTVNKTRLSLKIYFSVLLDLRPVKSDI
jgi:hypothetical protein